MKKLLFLLLVPMMGMSQSKDGFVLKGNISGLKDSIMVFLMNANDGKTIATDVVRNGNFTLKGKINEPDMFQLGFIGYKENLEVFLQNDNMTINGELSNLANASVTGSAVQEDFNVFKQQFLPYINKLKELGAYINAEPDARRKDSLLKVYNMYKAQAVTATNAFIKNKPASPVSSLLLVIMMPGFESIDELEAKYAQLQSPAKKGTYARSIEKAISDTRQAQRMASVGQVGTHELDFVQTDVQGKNVSLSSFKGKYVLVDFWASWCRPCRAENPNVVNAYNQYKNKNFTVLGVSLDQAKPNWLQAIQADNLTWTHVSDLQFWNNAVAQLYHIQSIPANMLIDPTGKIIARDLRGEDLNRKLSELLK